MNSNQYKTKKELYQQRVRRNIQLWEEKMFPPLKIDREPRFIPLADDTPNPHGLIAPPNSPVTPKGNKP